MLQASQRQVVHSTNVNLVQLRAAEISYFSDFFNNFGTQSAILGAMAINSATNIFGLDYSDCGIFWLYLFWISTACAFLYCLRLVVVVMFLSLYGQGLALRGPVGSMAKAVDGMVDEQIGIVRGFTHAVSSIHCYHFHHCCYHFHHRCFGQR